MGLAMTVMNVTTLLMSFVLPSAIRRLGTRMIYALCLVAGGLGFASMLFTSSLSLVLVGMIGVGVAWSAILTVPFIMTTTIIPPARTGVYMGILNAFICIPQILEMLTVGLYYDSLLGGDARKAIVLAGICLLLGAVACLFISRDVEAATNAEEAFETDATGMTLGKA
jgi:maltose/moltooligosaccharide transporter